MSNLLHDVTVRVLVEVTTKGSTSWDQRTIAKTNIEDVSSLAVEEIAGKITEVVKDAEARAQIQLNNTKRITQLEQQNKLLAESKTS